MKMLTIINKDVREALIKLSKEQIPLKTAYKLKGIIKRINEELVKYDEMRRDILISVGEKNENGELKTDSSGNVVFGEGKIQEFVSKHNELIQMDLDIETLTVGELGSSVSMSAQDLMLLDEIIKED